MANIDINYKYIISRNKNESGQIEQVSSSEKLKKLQINPYEGVNNPFFNFSQNLINDLQSITPLDLGQSIPYISLKAINSNGDEIINFNLKFFKQIDIENIATSTIRYADRPEMSLVDVIIKTTNSNGYLYFTDIKINIKFHRPDSISSNILNAFMFSGFVFELGFGWNGPDNNDFLNKKKYFYFNVKSYTVNINTNSEVDLMVEGMAFNNQIYSLYLGDFEEKLTKDKQTSDEESNYLIGKKFQNLEKEYEYIEKLKANPEKYSIDVDMIKDTAESFRTKYEQAKGNLKKKTQVLFQELKNKPGEIKRKKEISIFS